MLTTIKLVFQMVGAGFLFMLGKKSTNADTQKEVLRNVAKAKQAAARHHNEHTNRVRTKYTRQ